jgi:eukaryotic-like serine/threonine-protein kinase
MIGTTVDHFEIIEELGRGGMARVYKAWDSVLNRHVALKVLNADTGAPGVSDYDQVLHEARAASRLDHPNIAPV